MPDGFSVNIPSNSASIEQLLPVLKSTPFPYHLKPSPIYKRMFMSRRLFVQDRSKFKRAKVAATLLAVPLAIIREEWGEAGDLSKPSGVLITFLSLFIIFGQSVCRQEVHLSRPGRAKKLFKLSEVLKKPKASPTQDQLRWVRPMRSWT
jgi:hypothetical protein